MAAANDAIFWTMEPLIVVLIIGALWAAAVLWGADSRLDWVESGGRWFVNLGGDRPDRDG
jgi:hypothetical protein